MDAAHRSSSPLCLDRVPATWLLVSIRSHPHCGIQALPSASKASSSQSKFPPRHIWALRPRLLLILLLSVPETGSPGAFVFGLSLTWSFVNEKRLALPVSETICKHTPPAGWWPWDGGCAVMEGPGVLQQPPPPLCLNSSLRSRS